MESLIAFSRLLLQIKSYYGVSRNLLIKFKDDVIDETPTLAQVLSSESAISSQLDMSIRSLPGDHGLPLQQVSSISKGAARCGASQLGKKSTPLGICMDTNG